MKRRILILAVAVAVFLFAAVAYAAAASGGFAVRSPLQGWFGGGLYVGTTATADTANKVATIKRCTVVYDFPTLGGTGASQPGDTICAESNPATCTGVVFGDQVSMGIDQAKVNAFGTIIPYVSAADAIVAQACAVGITDGGSFNMPDASYTFTWMH